MACSIRGALTTGFTGFGTTFSIAKPTGVQVGDALVLAIANNNANSALSISGTTFTVIGPSPDSGPSRHLYLAYRRIDGTESSSFTVSWAGGSAPGGGVCIAVQGNDQTSLFDPSTPANAGAVTGTSAAPSIAGLENSGSEATTVAGAMLLWIVCCNVAGVTAPTGFTSTESNGTSSVVAMGYEVQSSAGTGGTQAGTLSTSTNWVVQLVAIKAAAPPANTGQFFSMFMKSFPKVPWHPSGLHLPGFADKRLVLAHG